MPNRRPAQGQKLGERLYGYLAARGKESSAEADVETGRGARQPSLIYTLDPIESEPVLIIH